MLNNGLGELYFKKNQKPDVLDIKLRQKSQQKKREKRECDHSCIQE